MSESAAKRPWKPPRWFMHAFWRAHRSFYRLTGGCLGLRRRRPSVGLNLQASPKFRSISPMDSGLSPPEFDDGSFDAVYTVQPMTYVSDHDFTFKGVFRVLKPAGMFVINDVAALDAYNRENEHQRTLIQHTREATVFGGFWYCVGRKPE